MSLFTQNQENFKPLADRMRPRTLEEFIGQAHVVGKGTLLRRAIEADRLTSCIFFGPPGVGKTTLASIIANTTSSAFVKLNAVTSGVAEVRQVIADAKKRIELYGQSTYLLLDECHRWSKSQSDSILPAIEQGLIRFIGSTTENPVIAMTPAIVSRCRLFQFRSLSQEDVKKALSAALADEERGFGRMNVRITDEAMEHLSVVANGDARNAMNALELAVLTTSPNENGEIVVDLAVAEQSIQHQVLALDESYFYDMLSAFCKSLRGSDTDAALAWYARMVHNGVDPRIIVRRVIAHSSEDVGMANPQAFLTAVAAWQALDAIGMPEAALSITQAIVMVCESPKSNAIAMARDAAFAAAEKAKNTPVPVHLRDTHYAGAGEKLGSGIGYMYPHNYPGHYVRQQYKPDDALDDVYYEPSEMGFEARIRQTRKERENSVNNTKS